MNEKAERIVALRDEGYTLPDIGATVGLSGERVRQVLADHGLRTMSHDDRLDAATTAWRASGELRRAADVAREWGIAANPGNLRELRRACPDLALPETKGGGSRWDREDIVAILRRIAADHDIDPATGWMRITDYTAWREDEDPSTAQVGANYRWSELLALAGFDPRNAPARGRQPGGNHQAFDDAALDAAVLAYLDSGSGKLSAIGLERFLQSRPDLPSMATIRNRFRRRGIGAINAILADVAARSR